MVEQVKKFAFDEERSKVDLDKDILFSLHEAVYFFLKGKEKENTC